jgi:hypothetical protein
VAVAVPMAMVMEVEVGEEERREVKQNKAGDYDGQTPSAKQRHIFIYSTA